MIPIRDNNPSATTPYITRALIVVNVLVFIYTLLLPYSELQALFSLYALIPSRISAGENLYSVFTAMFLHAGVGHVFGNMLFLWIFGNNVEDTLGHFKFLLFYFVCGLLGFLLQYFIDPYTSIPMLGASGAIAGVLGSYLVLYPYARIEILIPFYFTFSRGTVPARFMLVYWILFQFLHGLGSLGVSGGGVAYFAHIGGFATGWALTKIFGWEPKNKHWGW
ncbi:MAG: rhomboid family intramembrane serine protease [Patescibacteria group bacterium]|nr:rhomboid family intramembrane serine protease [Patescibacteria group bacterium]